MRNAILVCCRSHITSTGAVKEKMSQPPGSYDCISPIDFRYWDEKMAGFLSEDAFTRYKLRVELALVTVLCQLGLCDQGVVTRLRLLAPK